jgi:nitroimidazol reductase NimA-like FMN-containing flavoprotein (pyridoxamine 5'-phosphate oxidase superfamily)
MEFDRNGLEVLGRDECLRLLTGSTLGRIGVTSGALPVILPVNFMVRDEHIFIRTGKGTKLDTATRNSVVVFEVDDFEAFDHSGWSVLVTGIARNAGPSAASLSLTHAPPRWAPSPDQERVISISIDLISGRRITIDAFAALVESGLDTSD